MSLYAPNRRPEGEPLRMRQPQGEKLQLRQPADDFSFASEGLQQKRLYATPVAGSRLREKRSRERGR